MKFLNVLLASLLLSANLQALAQDPISTQVDPEALAIATDIVNAAYPPDSRDQMLGDVAATIGLQSAVSTLDDIEDEGARAVIAEYLVGMTDRMRTELSLFIPRQMEATAIAYADTFTMSELLAIREFAQSAAGSRFLQESPGLLSHPEIAAANAELFAGMEAFTEREKEGMIEAIVEYMEAQESDPS